MIRNFSGCQDGRLNQILVVITMILETDLNMSFLVLLLETYYRKGRYYCLAENVIKSSHCAVHLAPADVVRRNGILTIDKPVRVFPCKVVRPTFKHKVFGEQE